MPRDQSEATLEQRLDRLDAIIANIGVRASVDSYFAERKTKHIPMKKMLWPPPVYKAIYQDGSMIRMSFAAEHGKPIDPEPGRRLCNMVYMASQWRNLPFPYPDSFDAARNHEAAPMVAGFVEHATLGDDPVPHETLAQGEAAKTKRKVKTCTCPNCGTTF